MSNNLLQLYLVYKKIDIYTIKMLHKENNIKLLIEINNSKISSEF